MFRLEHPEYLWVLAMVLPLVALLLLSRFLSAKAGLNFATDAALKRLTGQWSGRKAIARSVFMLSGFVLLSMALTNPQWGVRRETVEAKAADVFIALDISNSMYAQDIAPSRMERAKKFAIDLVQALRGERIGLILFAGSAYLQMPLTTDYAAAELFIKSAHPGLASTQGTAIGEAIDLAMRAFTNEEGHQKALIVLTDGEDHEEGAVEAMRQAADAGMVPFLISVGTEEGAFIPIAIQGREDYKRDENGVPVRSVVNPKFLRELADAGNGHVYQIVDGDFVIRDVREKIDLFEKRKMEQQAFKDFDSYYQYFLAAGIFLFLVAALLSEQRRTERTGHIQAIADFNNTTT